MLMLLLLCCRKTAHAPPAYALGVPTSAPGVPASACPRAVEKTVDESSVQVSLVQVRAKTRTDLGTLDPVVVKLGVDVSEFRVRFEQEIDLVSASLYNSRRKSETLLREVEAIRTYLSDLSADATRSRSLVDYLESPPLLRPGG